MVDMRRPLTWALLSLALGGCASLPLGLSSAPPAPTVNPSVPTADQLATPYRVQAEQLEQNGRLRPALEAWTTALALAPNHEPSRQAFKRLRERIDREVAEQVRLGWHALARDAAPEARRHFMAALALDPDSRTARDGLRATPAPPAAAAVPEPEAKPVPLARPVAIAPSDSRAPEPPKPRVDSSRGGTPATGNARPAAEPRLGTEMEKPDVLYASAKTHLAAHRDEDAYHALTQLVRVSPAYRDGATLLRDLRTRLVRQRYQEGLRLFREEMLEQAIEQWRGVLELDPKHADAHRNIDQAERMLRTLAAQPKR